MAELVYDKTGRLLFTKEMKEEYTILMPQMLPVHFGMFQRLLELEGYKVDMLTSNHRGIIDEGLKYVHNDTCYPALLVIGQLVLWMNNEFKGMMVVQILISPSLSVRNYYWHAFVI